jgi:DNA-binding MarR family transcriptional regulator
MSEFFRTDRHVSTAAPSDAECSVAAIIAHANRLAKKAQPHELPATTSPQFVRRILSARASRRQFFSADLFADPAWDILLELYALECEQRRISISKLCLAAAVPSTTALRWLDKLQSDGMITRQSDPLDARRVWVSMSPAGFEAMASYLRELARGYLPL